MSTIRIGNDERDLREADPQWINQEIRERRRDHQAVCVVIQIRTSDISMNLATPTCGGAGGGGGRLPNQRELEVRKLWDKLGLNEADFDPGNVVAFVKQSSKYL